MHDRVLLITGASSGIGAATARAAAREGYQLVLAARSADKLTSLAQELGPENVLTCEVDVTDLSQQQAMVEQAIETFGHIDAVFANAGRGGSPADPARACARPRRQPARRSRARARRAVRDRRA